MVNISPGAIMALDRNIFLRQQHVIRIRPKIASGVKPAKIIEKTKNPNKPMKHRFKEITCSIFITILDPLPLQSLPIQNQEFVLKYL